MPSDFKKKEGYKRSIELSQKFGLYRQDYCGCGFSKAERERQKTEAAD
nr:epoxyqueuosine reductase QueH [Butyrivibrio sp. AE3003]